MTDELNVGQKAAVAAHTPEISKTVYHDSDTITTAVDVKRKLSVVNK